MQMPKERATERLGEGLDHRFTVELQNLGMPGMKDIPALIRRLGSDLSIYADQKAALLKAELREEAHDLLRGGTMVAVGGFFLLLAFSLVSIAIAFLVGLLFPFSLPVNLALGFLLISTLYVLVGAVVLGMGKRRFSDTPKTPTKSIDDLKRDRQWLQNELI